MFLVVCQDPVVDYTKLPYNIWNKNQVNGMKTIIGLYVIGFVRINKKKGGFNPPVWRTITIDSKALHTKRIVKLNSEELTE